MILYLCHLTVSGNMHTQILPSQAPTPNMIDTERNSFTVNNNTVRYLKLRLSGIQEILLDSVSERMH